jgi:hypothetical protein
MANAITGVSSKYRCYISNLKQIRVCMKRKFSIFQNMFYFQTFEHCDVYAFGRVLYELSTGEECPTSVCLQFPNTVPIPVQHILLKILAPTGDLPTIQQLLDES